MTDIIFNIFSLIFGLSGMTVGIIAATRNRKTDIKTDAKEDGMVLTELGYIKAGVDDLKHDNREIRADMQLLHERITRNEESCKQAHKRINDLAKYHEPT